MCTVSFSVFVGGRLTMLSVRYGSLMVLTLYVSATYSLAGVCFAFGVLWGGIIYVWFVVLVYVG